MVRKAGIMSTLASTLGTIETVMSEVTTAVDTLSSYNSNWAEARQLDLARNRFERDLEWMKLGEAVLTTQFNKEAIQAAKDRYIDSK